MIGKNYRKQFALLLSIVLILSPFSGITGLQQAESASLQPNVTSVKEMNAESASEKVDVQVQEAFTYNDYVDVIIELTEQVDTSEVAAQAIGQLADSATAHEEKMARRYAVFDHLKLTAEKTQASLISYLEKAQDDGEIETFESFYIMNVIHVRASKKVVERLSYQPEVARIKLEEFIELDLPEANEGVQDDVATEWNIDRVQAPEVWDAYGIDGSGVVVGVIDSGVDWQHEAIQSNWRGFDPNDPYNPDPYGNWLDRTGTSDLPVDTVHHGTHVTGTVMGHTSDGENIIGVAPGAQWIAARAFTDFGASEADLLASGEYMLAPEDDPSLAPDIIQNSWGGAPGKDEWYRPMVEAWRDAGQMPVFSAGNSGPGAETVTTPANYPESYAVAATDMNDDLTDFSSRGPGPYDGDLKPNISAPGESIRSSIPGGGYAIYNGTSMAAPHIAGAAAMLLSVDASLTVDDIEDILDSTSTPLTDDEFPDIPNDGYGVGLVNVFDAVANVTEGKVAIEGSVLTEGSDDEGPEISHSPMEEGFANMDIPVHATVTDDVAVAKVEIIASHEDMDNDILVPMELQSGDHTDGHYSGYIPGTMAQEPGFEYQINAYDHGGNKASTESYSVNIEFGLVPDEYSEDFAQYPTGWMMGGDWEWGEPTVGPDPVVGNNLLATNLSGYNSNTNSSLMSPPIDLRNTDEASIRANQWYDIAPGFNMGRIAVSNDHGENWEIIEEISEDDREWENLYIDLNDYAGSEEPVFILFDFISGFNYDVSTPPEGEPWNLGWYLDNVHLVGEDTTPPEAPENVAAHSTTTGIQLTWDAPNDLDVTGYNVYRSELAGGGYEWIGSATSTHFSDTDVEGGSEYYYVITAFDYADNESDYSDEVFIEALLIKTFYHNNFSEDEGGFTIGGTNSSWEWGEPDSGPGEALTGDHLWATNLEGNYNTDEYSWIESPEIEIKGVDSANLHFTHWQDIYIFHSGYLQISTDGGNDWKELDQFTNEEREWSSAEYSLDDYIGETIQLRFVMETDFTNYNEGWYIDEVMIAGTTDSGDDISDEVVIDKAVSNEMMKNENENYTVQHEANIPEFPEIDKETAVESDIDVQVREEKKGLKYEIAEEGSQVLSEEGLPLDAVITVLETGRTVQTNPVDGSYRILHAPSEGEPWTVRAEAYGYYSQVAEVFVEENETTYQNFMLEPVPRGEVEGKVINERTGEGVKGVTVRVVNDTQIPLVQTDEVGSFVIPDVLEGEYTLQISAKGYHTEDIPIEVEGGETTDVTGELKPFIGFENEIAYDNGTAENALALHIADSGFGVRMTPDGMAELRGANLFIWGEDWPVPGGNEIQIAVYDTDESGNPKDMVIGPVDIEVERGGWNYIDLSEYGFMTDRDFMITTIQQYGTDLSPGLGADGEVSNAERSYIYYDGIFQEHFETGNIMIRANIAYSFEAPVIETPVGGTFIQDDSIKVSGTVSADSGVTIYNNGEAAAEVEAEDGQFTAEISLYEGENEIIAEAEVEDGISDPSEPVTVIKDTVAPEVSIESPEDGYHTNRETVTVEGTASDDHLDTVLINGRETAVADDNFSQRIMLDEGENVIEVAATDLAGNKTTKKLSVFADYTAPEISNLTPNRDQYLETGQSVKIEFESEPDLRTSFVVHMPLTDFGIQALNATELPMMETTPGNYVGYYTVPLNTYADGAVIEVKAVDDFRNESRQQAEGRLYINLE